MACFPNDVRAHLLTWSQQMILERWHNAQTSFGLFEEDLLQYMLSIKTNPMMLKLYLAVKPLLAVKVPHILPLSAGITTILGKCGASCFH